MKDKKVVLQALLCFALVVSLILPGAVAGASPAAVQVMDEHSITHSAVDSANHISTIYVPDDHPTIQAAVDAASSGDTIVVRDGTYTENVNVNKRHLTIRSDNGAERTIVQAPDVVAPDNHVFRVVEDYVRIIGFTIQGARQYANSGVYLEGGDSEKIEHCEISDNIISDNERGIYLWFSSNNILARNVVAHNGLGIFLFQSEGNALQENTINSNVDWGVYLAFSSNNTLTHNMMVDNSFNFNVSGIWLSDFLNDIDTSNTVNGKPIQYLIGKVGLIIDSSWDIGYLALVDCSDVTVKDLTLSDNGAGLLLAYTNNSRIENVYAMNNSVGIHLLSSCENTLTSNAVHNNFKGFTLEFDSNDNVLTNNAVTNQCRGIHIDRSSNNIITKNTIADNTKCYGANYGIYLVNAAHSNMIYLNSLVDNTINAHSSEVTGVHDNTWNSPEAMTYRYNGDTYTNYLGNYWSDYTGSDTGGDGIGDAPYVIGSEADSYPLMEPFENYEVSTQLIVVTVGLPDGYVGDAYEATLEATGGTQPYTWAIVDGDLPRGLDLDADTGTISGTPTETGTFNFTVQVSDAGSLTAVRDLSITIHPYLANPVRAVRYMVVPGQEFEVAVTFTAPEAGFNAIGLFDAAPPGWAVAVNPTWTTPAADVAHAPALDEAAYIWFGPHAEGIEFAAAYKVQVPPGAEPGTYAFTDGTLTYYVEDTGPHVEAIAGDWEVEVVDAAAVIAGQTREVNCDILSGVTVCLYDDQVLVDCAVSNGDGVFTLPVPEFGDYIVVASKHGYRDQERTISVTEPMTYTVDFIADHGLIPDRPGMSYVLSCVNLWQFGTSPCKLTMSTALAVINAWRFPIEEEAVHFPDPNLKSAIREAIGKPTGEIYPSDLEGLTVLRAPVMNIADLTGLEYCINLTTLFLHGNDISDISPLANLTRLTDLHLGSNQISDISPLANLTRLTKLRLWRNQIIDISPLTGLTSLTYLDLRTNQISDISPLTGLTSLTGLGLAHNEIADISALANLGALHTLELYYNPISDISPLSRLTNLSVLSFGNNQIANISPLTNLTNLTLLFLSRNQISDISPLSSLTNLIALTLDDNQIIDISPLSSLTNLIALQLDDNQIIDISPLSSLTNLVSLHVQRIQISDILPLSSLSNLTELWLTGNQIIDISPLSSLTNLTRLYLDANQISDISPLAGLTSLTRLSLLGNQIIDISPLEGLTNLAWLHLGGNQISDVNPLVQNLGLGTGDYVNLYQNPLSDDSVDIYIPVLQARGVTVHY